MNDSSSMRIAELALISGIVVAVLAFGGTEPAPFAAVEILLFGTAAWVFAKRGAGVSARPLYFVVPVFLVLWGFLQLCPLPAGLLRLAAKRGDSADHGPVLSLAPYQTRVELLILLACFAAFYLTVFVTGERDRKRRLIHALVVLGAGEAFYGLIQYLANWQVIWWYSKKYDLEEATGTYINRNHFAGFLEMVLPFAVALALYETEKLASNRANRVRRSRKASSTFSSMSLWLAIAVVLMAALVFSRSRMGLLAAAASLIVMFSLAALQKKTGSVAIGFAFIVLSLSLAGWIGLRPALTRFEDLPSEMPGHQETRLSIWPGAAKLIAERPLLGNGLGTLPVAYTPYQTSFLTKYVNHAHNDYLEFASDLGIPAALLLFGSVAWVLVRAMRDFFRADSRFERNISLACVGSIVGILLHSLTDFNLYIPANALLFAVILGVALSATTQTGQAEAQA
jgi:O-antigen ligase